MKQLVTVGADRDRLGRDAILRGLLAHCRTGG
jgi:hypothetical protein